MNRHDASTRGNTKTADRGFPTCAMKSQLLARVKVRHTKSLSPREPTKVTVLVSPPVTFENL